MSEARKKADWPVVAALVLALFISAVGIYIGGYYWLAKSLEIPVLTRLPVKGVQYDSQWLAEIYKPAGRIEQFLTGRPVVVHGPPIPEPEP